LRGFEKFDNCEIIAVCDSNEKNLEYSKNFIRRNNPKFFKNFEDVLKIKELNAVVIAVPNYLHRDFTIAALERNLDVFLEKPVANNITACDEIIEKLGDSQRIIQIGLVYRYSNLYRTIAQLVEKGTFGNVMMMYCKEYRDNFPTPWFFDKKKSGGAILDKDCHHFDIFNWYINSPPFRVFAFGGQHVVKGENYKIQCSYAREKNIIINNPDIVDHAFVVVEYENGAKANLGLCMYEIEPIEGLEIGGIGDNGSHFIAKNDTSLFIGGGPIGDIREVEIDYFGDNLGIGHIGCQIERKEFLECVEKRIEPYANLYVGRQSIVVALAAEKSIEEGRIVYIKEFENPKIEEIFRKRGYLQKRKTPPPATSLIKDKEIKKKMNLWKVSKQIFKIGFTLSIIFIKFFPKFTKLVLKRRVKKEFGKEFFKNLFEVISSKLKKDREYINLTKGLSAIVKFVYEGKELKIKIENGLFKVEEEEVENVSVFLTKRSLIKLLLTKDIQKLFLTKEIRTEGEIARLLYYSEALLKIPLIIFQ
jgi:predicted dehydrogenase